MSTFEASTVPCTVTARFEQMVAAYPTQCALQTAQGCWSYAELNRCANQIAHRLITECGAGQGQVAILCATLVWQVAATLAVIKSGKTVVLLDTALPAERLRLIITDAQAELLLVDAPLAAAASALGTGVDSLSIPVRQVDTTPTNSPCENLQQAIAPTDPLGLLYTSGSTGQPKGVIITHQAELHSAWSKHQTLPLGPHPRGAVISSLAYAATWGMAFRLLLCGGCLCEYGLLTQGFTPLAAWLEQEQITLLIPPIALIRQWCQTLATPISLPHLRNMEFIGAQVTKQDLHQIRAKLLGTYSLTLLYGSTEALNVTAYRVADVDDVPDDPLPAGYVVPDKEVLILDEWGLPIGQGESGEIVIQSRYIAPGYWQRAELTHAKFATSPEDPTQHRYFTGDLGYQDATGCLYITGRKDFMVKLRGYAVDLTEVEQTLGAIPAIHQAVVKMEHTAQQTEAMLIAYVMVEATAQITVGKLRQQLAQRLPIYMIPARFVRLETFPLTPNGKIDRQAIGVSTPSHAWLDTAYVAPRTPLEESLVELWGKVLGLEQVGIDDDFLALGGNSLAITRLASQLLQEQQLDIPLSVLLNAPTVADQALAILHHLLEQQTAAQAAALLDEVDAAPSASSPDASQTGPGHWSTIAQVYHQTQSPLHPCAEDISIMERFVARGVAALHPPPANPPALLLGVTPAIATMQWPAGTTLLAVDSSAGMLDTVWPGDQPGARQAQCGNWLALPVGDGTQTVVIGDGSLNCLEYPTGWQQLVNSVARVLGVGGSFVLRVYTQPPRKPSVSALFQELMAGRFHTFDGFKFLLNSALTDDQFTVAVQTVWQQWAQAQIDEAALCRITGWSPATFATIAYYQNSSARYAFPPLAAVQASLAPHFDCIDLVTPSYPLGEYCPILYLRKRS